MDGRRIVDRLRDALAPLVEELFVIGDPARLPTLGLPIIPDLRAQCGPLAGLESALTATTCDSLILIGGDMPFVTPELLIRLVEIDPEIDAACFQSERGPEPLCARYSKRLLPRITSMLDANQRRLRALFTLPDTLQIPLTTESERRALTNINTPQELARARSQKPPR